MQGFDLRWTAMMGNVRGVCPEDLRKFEHAEKDGLSILQHKGKIITLDKVKCKHGDPLLAQWIDHYYYCLSYNAATIQDAGNAGRAASVTTSSTDLVQTTGNETYGIRLGMGNTGVVITDYTVANGIFDGTGANQLVHTLSKPRYIISGTTTRSVYLSRGFANYSGSSITVEECGIFSQNSAGNQFLLARDLTGSISVAQASVVFFMYDFTISV